MAWTFKTSSAQGLAANGGTTTGIDTTGCTYLVVGVASYYGTNTILLTSFSDNQGGGSNTWSSLGTGLDDVPIMRINVFECVNPGHVGSGHTFTLSGANANGTFPSVVVLGFSGNSATPDDQSHASFGQAAGTTVQPGSISPTQDKELIVAFAAIGGAFTGMNVDSGLTLQASIPGDGANYEGSAGAYLIQGTAATINPQFSWTTTQNCAALVASLKDDGLGGSGGGNNPFITTLGAKRI